MIADNQQERLNGYWITGFIDGEGCFHIQKNKNNKMKYGFQILPEFRLVQHIRDIDLLKKVQNYFKMGVVRRNSSRHRTTMEWRVRSIKDLLKLIEHFKKYPLQSKKLLDLEKFKHVVNLVKAGLKESDIEEIEKIKLSMNRHSTHRESPETKR